MIRPTDEEVARWAESAVMLTTRAEPIMLRAYAGRLASRVAILAAEVQRLRAEAEDRPPPADAVLLAQANRALAAQVEELRAEPARLTAPRDDAR